MNRTPVGTYTGVQMTRLEYSDLPDGQYTARLQLVDDGYDGREGPRYVIAEFVASDEREDAEGTHVRLPFDAVDPPVTPGMVYRVAVVDGTIERLCHDWEATVRATATAVPADELVVPLRDVHERSGAVARNRSIATFNPSNSVLVAGEPGAGKTEFIKTLLSQLRANPADPVVIFNYKDDYGDFARRLATDEVVRLSTRGSSHVWNVFREAETEADFERIGNSLFKDREENSTDKKFFPITARQVLVAALKYLAREGQRSGLQPDNRELIDFLNRFSVAEMYELIGDHEDLRGDIEAMNPEATKQSIGIVGTLQSLVNDTLGVGDFARQDGTFSIREYFSDPDGRVLLLDYPLEEGDRVTDIFRVFLDAAIQYALADPERQATFVLDEFARIPRVDRMKALVATGRARSVQSVVGVQSVAQLAENYGEDTADALLSGLTQEVFLRAGDVRTLNYYTSRLGRDPNRTGRAHETPAQPTERASGLWDRLQRLDDGEGYVLKQGGYAHVSVPMLSQLGTDTRRAVQQRRADRGL